MSREPLLKHVRERGYVLRLEQIIRATCPASINLLVQKWLTPSNRHLARKMPAGISKSLLCLQPCLFSNFPGKILFSVTPHPSGVVCTDLYQRQRQLFSETENLNPVRHLTFWFVRTKLHKTIIFYWFARISKILLMCWYINFSHFEKVGSFFWFWHMWTKVQQRLSIYNSTNQ